MPKSYHEFVTEEVGLRNLKKIIGDHKEFEIWFHKDLDGVTSALAMRHFLEKYYNLKLIDCHIIQYGGLEFAIKHGKPGTLKVLVDFAHSRPMFVIATDHHDSQIGGESTQGAYFKPARSNVETISGEISYSDIFTPGDIELIKTVDSADFFRQGITTQDVRNSIFQIKTEDSGQKNRFMMGFVVNRLLLAYKNKRISVRSMDGKRDHINKNILECMVLDCNPSLISMFTNLKHYINTARVSDKSGVLAKPEELTKNIDNYIQKMRDYRFIEDPDTGEVTEYDPQSRKHQFLMSQKGAKVGKGVHYDDKDKIIIQYGGGSMIKPGSYDRYVPFNNFPEANFICMVWPLGLIQVSCNPFREKKLKDIDLGKIAKEVLATHEPVLSKILISLDCLKKEFETSQDWKKMQKEEGPDYQGVGFRYTDLLAFYGDNSKGGNCIVEKVDNSYEKVSDERLVDVKDSMNSVYDKLSQDDFSNLQSFYISIFDLIKRNSGGHPSITNLQGWGFLKYNSEAMKIAYGVEKYTDVMKKVGREFVDNLKDKIDLYEQGKSIEYSTKDIEFTGQDINENYEFEILHSDGKTSKVSKDEFVNAGFGKAMRPERLSIDDKNKKIIAKFENFKYKK